MSDRKKICPFCGAEMALHYTGWLAMRGNKVVQLTEDFMEVQLYLCPNCRFMAWFKPLTSVEEFEQEQQALEELEKAERSGEEASDRAALCLRVIHGMEQTIEEGRRAKDIFDKQTLTAEVVALERIAAMRGNIPDGLVPKE